MRTASGITLLLCCWFLPAGLAAQVPPDLAQAVRTRDEALDRGDIRTWELMTAPAFALVGIDGRLRTRAERLAQLRAQPARVHDQQVTYVDGVPLSVTEAREEPGCGVDRILVHSSGTVATRWCLTQRQSRLEVWAQSGSGWQVIAAQHTPVR